MNLGLKIIRNKIRNAQEPDNPTLISLWLAMEEQHQSDITFNCSLQSQYESQFYLLLETIVDELIPTHWRRICLDNIYKPLGSLQRITNDEQSKQHLSQLFDELSVSCRYVEQSLNQ